MKKLFFVAIAICVSVAANAQYTKFVSQDQQQKEAQMKSKKGPKSKAVKGPKSVKDTPVETKVKPQKVAKIPVMKIDAKYAEGSCPLVDGKVEWEKSINCPGKSAGQIYDKALKFLDPYCKESNKDENSQIALINPTTHEIGARIGEYVVFQSSAFSLDRAMMHYTLCLFCSDGKCKVVMKSISYKYQDKFEPGEDRLSDANALNKTKTDFKKGGYEKFRTKTIDAKDALFEKLAQAINH